MIDEKKIEGKCDPEKFKEILLDLERDNLRKLHKDEKKVVVAKIIRIYEGVLKDDNK